MEKRLILMRGCPSSGKSTLAREVAGCFGAKIYSADIMLMIEDFYGWTPELAYPAHKVCQQLVDLAMQKNEKVVIVDNTNLKPQQARPYVNFANKHGYTTSVLEPNTPWKHNLEELIKRGTHNVPRETLERMLTTWISIPLNDFRNSLGIGQAGN